MPVVSPNPGAPGRELGKALIVAGAIILLLDLIGLLWIGWDIRAGNRMMQIFFWADAAVGVILILWGMRRKSHPRG